ncbi:MAG TPA: hypothetical protein PLL28_08610 [Chitinophagales bacterium]|nr:hypothetical protein [Chitinophagales bacterium]HNA56965.1 hypothetical protein [Chitinophagales bacterium]HNE45947.1 hypothetical protein [Chitinophagales bacterium]HNF69422.1 hypothetical protein [Chitinophagales bacterium]HNJ88698.1 hypothetical protein [Chitinophagales bacterium]
MHVQLGRDVDALYVGMVNALILDAKNIRDLLKFNRGVGGVGRVGGVGGIIHVS